MRQLAEINLTPPQGAALKELQSVLQEQFDVQALVLYGSSVRGESDEESDMDLLVVTDRPFSRARRHEITDLVFEVNLRHGTNISTLVVDKESWESGPYSIIPIHEEIINTGVPL